MQWWLAASEVARNVALLVGAAAGVFLAWRRVTVANRQAEAQIKQAELARRDHVAELFNRAVGQLRDEKQEVRLGAIFLLDQVCRDFPDLSEPVLRLLSAYLKENVGPYGEAEPPPDIREIMEVIRSRS